MKGEEIEPTVDNTWGSIGEMVFLLPYFWQSLGKALGWKQIGDKPSESYYENFTWLGHWHRFIDHLAEGKTAKSFFESLP